MAIIKNIDVLENYLRRQGPLLDILLKDRTTGRNIIWATDSYAKTNKRNDPFHPTRQIKPELVTGVYGLLIQPRAVKSKEEQRRRTKDKAEVFTPLKIVKQMNQAIDQAINETNPEFTWQEYVRLLKLEITCGEAPYIVARYDPTLSTGKMLPLKKRIGFLDKKLALISKHCIEKNEWYEWVKEAYKASYGYEWQGDNVLLARENLLYSFYDYYRAQFMTDQLPPLSWREEIATIISWNIWQMDGLKYVVPMSCKHETRVVSGEKALFWETPDAVEKFECEGCKFNRPNKHNGKYVKIKDWADNKTIKFVELLS